MSLPPIQLIAGPTASGKSALALKLARETGAVIINADSQQLYADLRVLTARPTPEDEAAADHRLYGVADAAEAWSVGRWSRTVMKLLAELNAERRPAILVGGTGLYFNALTRGLAEIPPIDPSLRAAIETEYEALGETAFRAWLAEKDPKAASRIEQGDRQRLIRAVSVLSHSGRSLTEWQADTRPLLQPGSWKGMVLNPARAVLYARCNARADLMVDDGAVEETKALLARQLDPTLPAMKAVGVRELTAFLDGRLSADAATDALKQATRNYAKRQLTWQRNQMADWSQIP